MGDVWGSECWSWLVHPPDVGRAAAGSSSWYHLRVIHELQLAGHCFIFTVDEARWPTVRAVPFELVTRSERLSAHNPKQMTTGSNGVLVVMLWWGGSQSSPLTRSANGQGSHSRYGMKEVCSAGSFVWFCRCWGTLVGFIVCVLIPTVRTEFRKWLVYPDVPARNPKQMTTGSNGVPVVMLWWGGGPLGPVVREVSWTRVLLLG